MAADPQGSRYAIFFAPPADGALWRTASALIGYDAETGENPASVIDDPDWPALTAEPKRYGFHGTLRAPFHLRDGAREADLLAAATALAGRWRPFAMPPLDVGLLGAFAALVPAAPSGPLDALAADCVTTVDAIRAPLSAADRDRRQPSRLSARQVAHLDRWGYPYVFEEFRFHMTLTGPLPEDRRTAIRDDLARRIGSLGAGLDAQGIAIFRQDDRAGAFRVSARIPFGGVSARIPFGGG